MKKTQKNQVVCGGWFCMLAIFISGCSAGMAEMKATPIVPVEPIRVTAPAPGSIWPGENARNLLFADRKAWYVNDIVTIIVNELSQGGNKATTNTGRDTKTTAGISALLGMDTSLINNNANLGGK
ncbi:MAG: flagellar basal body L-ring protein FlgH, partial [Syntrophales bacterium]